ncbi:glucose 1-dehydrogenase [Acinetobacter qingfengensis]|uniref:Short-chain dehydrogenase n=2 Tax=Acinetobacter qingfengensis TaxID=1262585 RepID=A0A1E7RC53_9GAMM|nr:glucose 1-dehydrogenase [Acinetobacter qingfengensis]OEY97029.1 short-chain dehydrogenase [Acinetobacter qingfengensis]
MQQQQKIAIVTGATGGIGQAICITLIQAGYQIVGLDIDSVKVQQQMAELGHQHTGFGCDLSDYAQIGRVVQNVGERFGQIDLIVNNAAVGPTMSATIDTSIDEFKQAISVNWTGPLQLIRECLAWMSSREAAIVNIASLAGLVSNPKRNAYSASKAAMISLTHTLACELAATGIRVNAIAPGYVRTPMVAALESSGKIDLQQVRQRIPMGRLARPEEIAKVVNFLASTQAAYITGSIVTVDGGWACFNQAGTAYPAINGIPEQEIHAINSQQKPRVVIVTGAAQGIGQAIAERFAQQGDQLILLDCNQEKLTQFNQKLGLQHLSFCLDIGDEQQVKQVFSTIRQKYSTVDILITNAGLVAQDLPNEQSSIAVIEKLFATNLEGAFCCMREIVPAMQNGQGMIINVDSSHAYLPLSSGHAYEASKAALEMLSRCLAAELAPQGIRIVTLCPGHIQTQGMTQLQRAGYIDVASICQRIPLGYLGQPQHVADAAFFLASDAATYINGAAFYVDGGWKALGNRLYYQSESGIMRK